MGKFVLHTTLFFYSFLAAYKIYRLRRPIWAEKPDLMVDTE